MLMPEGASAQSLGDATDTGPVTATGGRAEPERQRGRVAAPNHEAQLGMQIFKDTKDQTSGHPSCIGRMGRQTYAVTSTVPLR